MKNAIIEMEFNVPKEEYDSISIMIVNVGRAVLQAVSYTHLTLPTKA